MAQVVAHHLGQLGVGGAVTDAPAGHGVALGHAVDDDRAVFDVLIQRSEGDELDVVIHEVAVDLVRDDIDIVPAAHLRDGLELRAGVDHAGRVAGRVEHEHLGLIRDGGVQLGGGDLEIRLLLRRNDHGHRARLLDHLGIADPVGRGDDDLVPGVAQRHQGNVNRVLGARSDHDLPGLIFQAEIGLQAVAGGLAQLHQAGGRGVLGLVVLDGLNARLLDVLGRGEVRLACAEADDVLALCLHLLEQRIDRQRGGRLHARGDVGNRFQCHCYALLLSSLWLHYMLFASILQVQSFQIAKTAG